MYTESGGLDALVVALLHKVQQDVALQDFPAHGPVICSALVNSNT